MGEEGTFQVEKVFKITDVGTVAVGTVVTGTLRPGQKTVVKGKETEIKSIEENHVRLECAEAGKKIGINLANIEKEDLQEGTKLEFS